MAGRGPAPKPADQRRNRVKPGRGEWLELPSRNDEKPPAMPKSPPGGWAAGTKLAWKSWWTDPASLMWSDADLEAVRLLAYLHHDWERKHQTSLAAELRLRSDALGLSQKGKRDHRWRIVDDEPEAPAAVEGAASSGASRRQHLRAV